MPALLLAACLSQGAPVAAADAAVTLWAAGEAPPPVLCRFVGGQREEHQSLNAARTLAAHLGEATGAAFTANRAGAELPSPYLLVEIAAPERFPDLHRDGYVIEASAAGVRVSALSERGLFYGVYGLLREHLGFVWFSRNEAIVPKLDALRLAPGVTRREPTFAYFELMNLEASQGEFQYILGDRSTLKFTGNHTLYPLLAKATEANPEFLPMDDKGRRKANNIHLCYSAPGMPEALADALAAEVERRKGNVRDYIYFAGMGDWYGGTCQCDRCKAIYAEETWRHPDGRDLAGVTATLLRMINRTAELLEARYPGVQVGTFAYMSLEAPPAHTKPRANVHVWVPRIRHDTARPVDTSPHNAAYLGSLKRWCELAPGRVHVWDYGTNYENFVTPFPCLRSIARNIQVYHELGVAGLMIQGNYVSMGGDQVVLKNWVWSRLMWDPTLDIEALIREFCEAYYGPASGAVLAYLAALEAGVPPDRHANEFDKPNQYLRDDAWAELRRLAEAARAAAGDDGNQPWRRRVEELVVGLTLMDYWRPGPLVERDGALIREDFGRDTFPEVKSAIGHLREASPREWGDGLAYRLNLLRSHGGPVHGLRDGSMEVRVAPLQGGAIGPIRVGDRVAVLTTADTCSIGTRVYETIELPTSSRLTMVGPLGVAHWGSSARLHEGRREVEVVSGSQLRITGQLQRQTTRDVEVGFEVVTDYPLGDQTPAAVRWRDSQGAWHDAATPAPGQKLAIQGVAGVRVTVNGLIVDDEHELEPAGAPDGLAATIERPAEEAVLRVRVQYGPRRYGREQWTPYSERTITVTQESTP